MWDVRGCGRRTIISCDLDEPLTVLVDELPRRLRALREENSLREGTLVLVLRSCVSWDNFDGMLDSDGGQVRDRHGVLVLGGLAFVEGIHEGSDVGEEDPARWIEQACLALAGKSYDHEVPGLDPALEHIGRRRLEKEEARRQVEVRAKELLRSHLEEAQVEEFDQKGEFHVRGADGYLYLITNQVQHNVFRVEDGRRTFEYCIVVQDYVPNYDQMLAQMLLLRANPAMFHEITNTWELTVSGGRVYQKRGPPTV